MPHTPELIALVGDAPHAWTMVNALRKRLGDFLASVERGEHDNSCGQQQNASWIRSTGTPDQQIGPPHCGHWRGTLYAANPPPDLAVQTTAELMLLDTPDLRLRRSSAERTGYQDLVVSPNPRGST